MLYFLMGTMKLPYILCCFMVLLSWSPVNNAQQPTTWNVGVIYPANSSGGRVSRLALEIAAEEINGDPEFMNGSKLNLCFMDSTQDAYHEALAAMEIFKANLAALLMPEVFLRSHFIPQMAEVVHVPTFLFKPTESFLSEFHYSYLTGVSNVEKMAVLANIIRYYGWKEVAVLFSDDFYGNSGIQALQNELNYFGTKVIYGVPFNQKMNRTKVSSELEKLVHIQAHVFVVLMPAELGYSVLSAASENGMFNSGYVWIVNDDITHYLEFTCDYYANSREFQGIIGTHSYIPNNLKIRAVETKLKTRTGLQNAGYELTNSHALLEYDTLWMLANAFHALKINATFSSVKIPILSSFRYLPLFNEGYQLLCHIRENTFSGITGLLQTDTRGKHIYPVFEIVNFVGRGMRTVGYWSKVHGLSTHPSNAYVDIPLNANYRTRYLEDVIWPGGSSKVPVGFTSPPKNKKLRIAVPQKTGYRLFVHTEKDENNRVYYRGFCVDVFTEAIERLAYSVAYEFVPFGDGISSPNYNQLVEKVASKEFDGAIGDITITMKRMLEVAFTQPFIYSGLVVLVSERKFSPNHALSFLTPYSPGLWLTILISVLFTGLVICIVEHNHNEDFQGDCRSKTSKTLWFMFSTILSNQDERIKTVLGRSVMLFWLFFVLIINQSYVAYLTSALTVENLGPALDGIDKLVSDDVPIGYQDGSYVEEYLQHLGVSKQRLIPLNNRSSYATALHNGPENGGVGAIVDELPYIQMLLSTTCDFEIAGEAFRRTGWGFVFPKESKLAEDLSDAILSLSETNDIQALQDKWLKEPQCDKAAPQSTKLSVKAFLGLFSFTGTISIFAAFCYLVFELHRFRKSFKPDESLTTVSQLLKFLKEFVLHVRKTDGAHLDVGHEEHS